MMSIVAARAASTWRWLSVRRLTMSDAAIQQPFPWVPEIPPGEDELITDDGEPMETHRHRQQMNLLIDAIDAHWADRDDYFAGGNMFIYFSETQVKHNDFRGPDFFVVLNTEWRDRKAWVVWKENGRQPDVVIELLSESTAAIDRGEKKRVYERVLKVAEYYVFDPWTCELDGWRLTTGGYVAIEPDESGCLASLKLGLKLGLWEGVNCRVQATWLRWHTLDHEVIPTVAETAAMTLVRLDEEKVRADKEKARAEEENARANEEKVRADKEKARAEEENARANEENARANEEKTRANEEKARANDEKTRANEEKARANEEQARANEEQARANEEQARADEEKTRAAELASRLAEYERRFGAIE